MPFRFRLIVVLSAVLGLFCPIARASTPNYHVIGWSNVLIPGMGQSLMGNYSTGAGQMAFEAGTFYSGYSMSHLSPMTLDGVPEQLPRYRRKEKFAKANIDKALYADLLQEVGIKTHMVNTFTAYREAALLSGDKEAIARMDQRSTWDMFTEPFKLSSLTDPWVYIPVAATGIYTIVEYFTLRGSVAPGQRLTPYSNFLYALNYGVVQPIGSGVPEEMFYRGFLQNEFYNWVPSPYFAIPLSTAAFAFSHAPGPGRLTAAASGAYLGYLSYRYRGNLGPGITVHYWSGLFLGIETILLNHEAQRTTPPASFLVQVNF